MRFIKNFVDISKLTCLLLASTRVNPTEATEVIYTHDRINSLTNDRQPNNYFIDLSLGGHMMCCSRAGPLLQVYNPNTDQKNITFIKPIECNS